MSMPTSMTEGKQLTAVARPSARPAVFLDRDGVLVEDTGLICRAEQLRLLPGVPRALARLRDAGFVRVVISNQTVVARGLVTEKDLEGLHRHLEALLEAAGAGLDAIYVCPHHPNADLETYRRLCECRKPRPGLLHLAARELGLDLARSFMVGDRVTDVLAGHRAGCRAVLVETGRHLDPPIESPDRVDQEADPAAWPDQVLPDLEAAADWILEETR